MTLPSKNRIESIDLLRGLVMVIMALDHTRDFFHAYSHIYNPMDPNHSSLAIAFTRWITHFCAPIFCLLAGLSAFLYGKNKTKGELSAFLLKRGIWLVLIELSLVNFAWSFSVQFGAIILQVIWALGISMMVLAALIHLPKTLIFIFSCIVIFGHNLLDNLHFDGNVFWAIIHDGGKFDLSKDHFLIIAYPVVPWIAVMSLGYRMGSLYDLSFDSIKRKKILNIAGFSAIALFIVLHWTNLYGNTWPWKHYDTISKTLMSFSNLRKYPPSLLFLLMTLGPAMIFLANAENFKGRMVEFFSTFGRVPFFFYVLHIYVIHFIALIFAQLSGFGWQIMILPSSIFHAPELKSFGFPLWVVYVVWLGAIALTYPLCKKFDKYKMNHKEKWWLSYL
jgi:uncharacterized membrane protein